MKTAATLAVAVSMVVLTAQDWEEVGSWKGSGIKNTESFEIDSREWRINWTTTNEASDGAGVFQLYVYTADVYNAEDANIISFAANKRGTGTDVAYVRSGPGRYHLKIDSANVDWEVSVEAQHRSGRNRWR